ncbi:MAG: hypothetical protein WCC92_06500, partial [Candidatus Korobacteraceae bacterium]
PAITTPVDERGFSPASSTPNQDRSRLQPAAPPPETHKAAADAQKSGAASLRPANRRSFDSGTQKRRASAQDDNSKTFTSAMNSPAPAAGNK